MSSNLKEVSNEKPKAPLGQALKAGILPVTLVTIEGLFFGPLGIFAGGALRSLVSTTGTGTAFQPAVQTFYGMAMGWMKHL